ERFQVVCVAHSRRPGHVDRSAARLAAADFFQRARTGIKGVLMRREIQNAGVVPECVLSSVPVVNVPVDDQDSRGSGRAHGLRGDGDVVEEAETHGLVGFGVMSWRTDEGEPAREIAPPDGESKVDQTPGGEPGGGGGIRTRIGVRVELRERTPGRGVYLSN